MARRVRSFGIRQRLKHQCGENRRIGRKSDRHAAKNILLFTTKDADLDGAFHRGYLYAEECAGRRLNSSSLTANTAPPARIARRATRPPLPAVTRRHRRSFQTAPGCLD